MVYSSGDSGYHAPTLASRLTPAAYNLQQQQQQQQVAQPTTGGEYRRQQPGGHLVSQASQEYQQRGLPASTGAYLPAATSSRSGSGAWDSTEGTSSSLGHPLPPAPHPAYRGATGGRQQLLGPHQRHSQHHQHHHHQQQPHHLPRLGGHLFSQNPAISASLPNYAETRALMGSQLIDSGSLDYSIEEPLSLPLVGGPSSSSSGHHHQLAEQQPHHHRQHHPHQHHQPSSRQAGGYLGASGHLQQQQQQPPSHHLQQRLAHMRQSYYPAPPPPGSTTAAAPATWATGSLGGRLSGGTLSGATTAEPLPSSSLASFYRSSPGGGGIGLGGGGDLGVGGDLSSAASLGGNYALSRHSALPSLGQPGGLQASGRQRPVFQKSSSTPTRGAAQRQHSMSPPPHQPLMPAQQPPHHHHHRLPVEQLYQAGGDPSHPRGRQASLHAGHYPLGDPFEPLDQPADYELLPGLMERLGGRPARLPSDPLPAQQQQHSSRRLLPQIPPSAAAAEEHAPLYVYAADELDADLEPHQPRQRRRRSSLELERQQHRALGGQAPSDFYSTSPPPPSHHQPPPAPRISISPEPYEPYHHPYAPPGIPAGGGHHAYPAELPIRRPSLMAAGGAYFQPSQPLAYQHHQHHHHQQPLPPPRSMAMGSDSELNTRGLNPGGKLYYVHVPPARRSRGHAHHQSRGRQPPPPPPPPSQQSGGGGVMGRQQHSPIQQEFQPPEPRPRADHSGRRPPPPPPPTQPADPQLQQQQQRASRGVTFDGRTSAPLYGRERAGRSTGGGGQRDYLRTNSDEPYGATEQLGAHHQVAAFAEPHHGAHQQHSIEEDYQLYEGPSHTRSRRDRDHGEESGSLGSRASPVQQQQHQQQQLHKRQLSDEQVGGSGGERDSWSSQLDAAAAGSSQREQQERRPSRSGASLAEPSHLLSSRHKSRQQQQQRVSYEGSSLSDTEGAQRRLARPSAPQKQGTSSPPSSSTQPTQSTSEQRRERRARVRDKEQQSSNERSEAAGSSQSLKSQTGQSGQLGGSGGGLSKKSNSTTQLSSTGTKKRIGFRKKQVTLFSVHRSEEVVPQTVFKHLVKQTTSVSDEGLNEGLSSELQDQAASTSFVDGLGAGQIISRQALASPCLGHIQLSLTDNNGVLHVEVIRARDLQLKPHAKTLPSPYVKAYLMRNRKCIAKLKTDLARKTLDPLYQQTLHFHEDYSQCILQIIVWGDYGRMQHKILMGIVQVQLDDLDLSSIVIGWYKLFNPSCMTSMPSKSLRQSMLSSSTQSFT